MIFFSPASTVSTHRFSKFGVLTALLCIAFCFSAHSDPKPEPQYVPSIGDAKLNDELLVFYNPYCPSCRRDLKKLLPIIVNEASSAAHVYFVGLPLDESREDIDALVFMACAGKHNVLVPALSLIMQEIVERGIQSRSDLIKLGNSLGLSKKQLNSCWSKSVEDGLMSESANARSVLEVNSLPSIFYNGSRCPKDSAEDFSRALKHGCE